MARQRDDSRSETDPGSDKTQDKRRVAAGLGSASAAEGTTPEASQRMLELATERLHRAESDLKNLMESTQIAVMLLDRDLRITNFSAGMMEAFHLGPSDHGRPIGEVRSRLSLVDFEPDCRRVLRTLSIVEREASRADRRAHYMVRIVPYRTVDNVVGGVMMTCFDVTERKLREEERARLTAIAECANDAIVSVSPEGLITSWNAAAERLYGYAAQEVAGKPLSILVPPDRANELSLLEERAKSGERIDYLETVRTAKSGRRIDVSLAVAPIRDSTGQVVSAFILARDISDRKRVELQRVMMAETNHRLKNSLAIVSALARRTLRSNASPASFVAAFEGRLKAFGRTHNALNQENWVGIGVRQLVTSELEPYSGRQPDRAIITGPPVLLRPGAALTLGMTLHELASNAIKFGALSATGRVEVSWEVVEGSPDPMVSLQWVERGGPHVIEPTTRGLGRKLIEEMLTYELGARVKLAFEPEGARCIIEFPLSPQIGELPMSDGQLEARP